MGVGIGLILANVSPEPNSECDVTRVEQKIDPVSYEPIIPRGGSWPTLFPVAAVVALALLFFRTPTARAAWEQIAQFIGLQGKPEPASAAVRSEHEIEALDTMTPQSQAVLLLERSINHYRGANDQIARRVGGWRGQINMDDRLHNLFITAINSDDLRVRAAGIEIDIAARDLEKSPATIARLEPEAYNGEQGPRANALWDIGLLGNRGVEPDRAFAILASSIADSNANIRYWAVEGLSYLGTDATIAPLLQVLHDDPSPMIRERAACALAQSGMLSEKQRRSAVSVLLDFADDTTLNAETQKWVYQALRDITGEDLPHDSIAWRNWYSHSNGRWHTVTRDHD